MIPIQLTIQGLYSYQEKQTIDFTQLTAANLFGIFGSVGSGKSTILEAITFAIYGRTDRLNLSGDNRYYNMMNLKSNEIFIDFIFETGKKQNAYRAMVKGKRNGKKFEEVKTLERTTYQQVNEEWIPIENENLVEAIGLSYENFKRTIIIPQGQFQEFLQLGNKDRTQMMKELFNLGKYEFYYKVASLEGKNNAHKQNLEGQIQQLGEVNPEQINTYKIQLKSLDEELSNMNKLAAEQSKKEEKQRRIQQLSTKRSEIEKTLKLLLEQKTSYYDLEQKLALYEKAVLEFKHLIENKKTITKKIEIREKQLKTDAEKLKTGETIIAQLNQQIEALKPAFETREILKQRAEELSHLLRIKHLEQAVKKEDERLLNGTKVCDETIQQLKKAAESKLKQEEEIKATKKQLPDLALLSNIRDWHTEKNNQHKQLEEIKLEQKKLNFDADKLQLEIQRVLKDKLFNELAENTDTNATSEYLKQKTNALKEELKALNEQENHIRVKAQLKTYSEDLKEGAPCPLCGSTHHPEIFKTDDIEETLLNFAKTKAATEQQIEQINSAEKQLTLLSNKLQLIDEQQKQRAQKLRIQLVQMADHDKKFSWEKYANETELEKAFEQAAELNKQLHQQEKQLEEWTQKVLQAEKNKERYQAEVEKIRTALTVHQTELKTLSKQLKLILPDKYSQTPIMLIEDEKTELLGRFTQVEKEFTEKNNTLAQHTQLHNTLLGIIKANQNELEQDTLMQKKIMQQLSEQLKQSQFTSLDEIVTILSENISIETEKKKLAQFNEALLRSNSQLEEVNKEIGSSVYNAEDHKKLVEEVSLLKAQITQKNQEQGKITELLKKLEKDLASQANLRKELEKLELRTENIKTMKSLFKASGFVNYISSVYLQNLCNSANDRFFQLTRQKLSLEITPDNNFQVRDFMNGGKVRNVKTLSGGQTFQAALSLALALADNIQKITESNQNFFFLDEGFGSLDKDALAVVFDTLKSLRKENRIVGVISHVEEMQQEIDVHLRIENSEETGSRIISSWN